jgi:hypothetical protein
LTLATTLALRASANTNNEEVLMHLKELQQDVQGQASEMNDTIQPMMDILQGQAGPKLDAISAQIQGCLNEVEGLRRRMHQTRERAILTWLNFRQISWRYEEIPVAYKRTFRWIFSKPPSDNGWDDFTAHLLRKDVDTPYFINGKAGSGKSTLMKFIVNHHDTKKHLAQWAEQDKLIVAKFFFWNLGTSLQKSVLGMLRTLMHTILDAHPELIPAVFTEAYHNWKESETIEEPTYVELKRSFRTLIAKSAKFLKLCIFIDGIDEFEGDHLDISEFILSLASPKVKVVVSSRPINACLYAFRKCSALKLQDLTKDDMEIFVQDNLASHETMVLLTKQYPTDTREIVTEIQEKAQGVFLWVRLVVRLLTDGLVAGDTIEELRDKLRSLPPDLRDLYRRMMSKITPEDRVKAAKIFKIIHTWQSNVEDSFRTILLHFAIQPPSEVMNLEVRPLDPQILALYYNQTTARVRGCCCGLLEVYRQYDVGRPNTESKTQTSHMDLEVAIHSRVNYLHRTVAEFLTSDDVWDEMRTLTEPNFDPLSNLASACLAMVKVSGSLKQRTLLLHYLHDIVLFYQKATPQSRGTMNDYIYALDQTMTQYQNHPYEGQLLSLEQGKHWSVVIQPVIQPVDSILVMSATERSRLEDSASIFTFAARKRLVQYLTARCDRQRTETSIDRSALVLYTLESLELGEEKILLHDLRDTLIFLLRHVAQPDDLWFGRSLFDIARRFEPSAISSIIVLASFITTGHSPETFIGAYYPSGSDFLQQMIDTLQNDDDPENKNLGYRLEQACQNSMGNAYQADHTSREGSTCSRRRPQAKRNGHHNNAPGCWAPHNAGPRQRAWGQQMQSPVAEFNQYPSVNPNGMYLQASMQTLPYSNLPSLPSQYQPPHYQIPQFQSPHYQLPQYQTQQYRFNPTDRPNYRVSSFSPGHLGVWGQQNSPWK